MSKSRPNLYIPPTEGSGATKSKCVGYCKACDCMLCELDKDDGGYKCPRCGELTKTPSKTKKPDGAW